MMYGARFSLPAPTNELLGTSGGRVSTSRLYFGCRTNHIRAFTQMIESVGGRTLYPTIIRKLYKLTATTQYPAHVGCRIFTRGAISSLPHTSQDFDQRSWTVACWTSTLAKLQGRTSLGWRWNRLLYSISRVGRLRLSLAILS